MVNTIDSIYFSINLNIDINIIKAIAIISCIYYTNLKITNSKVQLNFKNIYKWFAIIVIAIIFAITKNMIDNTIRIISLILSIGIVFSKSDIKNGLIATMISITLNYIVLYLAIIINFIVNIIINFKNNYINLAIIMLLYLVILYKFLSIKKLKYGISFLKKSNENEYIDILILNISVTILFLTIILSNSNIIFARNILPGIIIVAFIMFIAIQKSLQLYYKKNLLEQNLEATKEELEKKKKEIEKLEQENLSFSERSHTLSHKQKSLERKLNQIIMKSEQSKEIGINTEELKERMENISKELYREKAEVELAKTGIEIIDDMFEYMQSECTANKIDFDLQINGNIHYITNNLITKEDLETLIADHVKNAIIAINHCENINKSILVKLGIIDGEHALYIYDSGIEFKKETLKNLGKKPSTTHADEGGTGMGFMNTFNTLRKYKASLIINEINKPSKEDYTKVIIIKFDKKNEFKIISYREGNCTKSPKTLELSTKNGIIVEN